MKDWTSKIEDERWSISSPVQMQSQIKKPEHWEKKGDEANNWRQKFRNQLGIVLLIRDFINWNIKMHMKKNYFLLLRELKHRDAREKTSFCLLRESKHRERKDYQLSFVKWKMRAKS